MKIVVTSNGSDLDAPASPVFGRCPMYIFVDPETMSFEAVANPAIAASGGAGVQAAQFVIEHGAEVIISGSIGPNAFEVFRSAGISTYLFSDGTVRQAVEAYKAGRLPPASGATSRVGMGKGRFAGRRSAPPASPPKNNPRRQELADLREAVDALRRQLDEILARLDELEQGD